MKSLKKPWLAFALSLVIPGAGLCYLNRWLWGVVNFLAVQLVLIGLLVWPVSAAVSEYFHYVMLILAAASAGIAHALAERMAVTKTP